MCETSGFQLLEAPKNKHLVGDLMDPESTEHRQISSDRHPDSALGDSDPVSTSSKYEHCFPRRIVSEPVSKLSKSVSYAKLQFCCPDSVVHMHDRIEPHTLKGACRGIRNYMRGACTTSYPRSHRILYPKVLPKSEPY